MTVLKRHGDMLELVLSSLQVKIGAALLFGIALPSPDQSMHDIFAVLLVQHDVAQHRITA